MTRLLIAVLALVAALSVPVSAAGATAPLSRFAQVTAQQDDAQPSTANTCTDLISDRVQLVRQYPNLTPRGAGPSPYPMLCLLHHTAENIYQGTILGVDGTTHFRSVKDEAARRLAADGVDACSVGTWDAYGRFTTSDRLYPDDQLDLPVECAPRIIALDAGASERLGAVSESVRRIVDLTGEQMGWRPNRSLTILAMTDVNVAVATTLRWTRGLSPADIAARAREGRSVTVTGSVYGALILLNLAGARDFQFEMDAALAHEYTHFAQSGIGASSDYFPYWFIEGQGDYQEERNASVRFLHRQVATSMQRDGSDPHLSTLSTSDGWFAQESSLGSSAVYSKGYVAVAYLIERHGFDATVQLLRDNHRGSIDRFYVLLANLTGVDLDTFDAEVGAWVEGLVPANR
jgi:hypothetical protein